MKILWNTLSRDSWCSEARQFADYSLYQHWDYGAEHARGIGRSVVRVAVHNGTRVAAMAQCRVKRLPFLGGGVAEVDWGPLWCLESRSDAGAVRALLEGLRQRLVGRQQLILRVTPPLRAARADLLCDVLRDAGFVRNEKVRAYRTLCMDLRDDLEGMRRRFRPRWRTHLNAAERKGLVITCSSSREAFAAFEGIYWKMWKRKRFPTGVRIPCIRRMYRRMPGPDKLVVSLASADGSCVAGHVAACLGDTCMYFLGATSEVGLRCEAGYALHWAVLKEAKRRGFTWYDLGGIDPDASPGVTTFKRGMRGIELEAAGQFDLSGVGGGARWYGALERGYRFARHVLQRRSRMRARLGVNGH